MTIPAASWYAPGDLALEIEPMGPRAGSRPRDAGGAEATRIMFAEDGRAAR